MIIDLWRGVFYRTYIHRYLELNPGMTRKENSGWVIPVAAGRLVGEIPGVQETLLTFIRSRLPT
jgi:hypothetical protein